MAILIAALTRIVLTADPELRSKLERKLKEYQTRMQFRAPETDPHGWYKLRLLGHLLSHGAVNVPELMADAQCLSWYDDDAFLDAASVIYAYNAGLLDQVRGGTGLK